MEAYFQIKNVGSAFQLFSIPHMTSLLIILAFNITIFIFRKKLKRAFLGYTIGAVLILQELSLTFWYIATDTWSLSYSLPLHLCSASVILSSVMMFTKSKTIYEILYFWGLGGALQALITPDLYYNFPHFRFLQFFLSHGLIITSVLFMTFVFSYRPTGRSIIKTFIITNIYLILIIGINFATDGNYLFIFRKPDSASLLDYLGPWPWYIFSLEVIAILLFAILYLPFVVNDLINIKKNQVNSYKG